MAIKLHEVILQLGAGNIGLHDLLVDTNDVNLSPFSLSLFISLSYILLFLLFTFSLFLSLFLFSFLSTWALASTP